MSSSYPNSNTGQQWSQYPRLQLEHEYDFSGVNGAPQGFAESYQFNPDAFTASPRTQQFPASQSTQSRSSSYGRHSPSASIDHNLYGANQQQQQFFQNSTFLTPDTREYHNNPQTYNFQAATSSPPLTATSLSAITTGAIARPPPPQSSSYYPPRATQPSKAKRQRIPEPAIAASNEKDDDMDGEMEEEGGARAKP
jgi:hypothetical protein